MTYEQFLDTILMSGEKFNIEQWDDFYLTDDGTDAHNRILCKKWISGGKEGGNCWGNKPESRDPDPEPEFKALTNILIHFAPALTFLQYKQIEELLKYDSKSEYEYYGNYAYYDIKYIKLEDLYNLLVDWEYIKNA